MPGIRKGVFLARNEKKFKYTRIKLLKLKAQSTLEYAIIFPMLFLMIMGIWELAFMWHQNNSMELVLQDISSNIALLDGNPCVFDNNIQNLIIERTGILHPIDLTYAIKTDTNKITYTSNQQYNGNPIVTVNIDCSVSSDNITLSPTVQLKVAHKLMFFAASLPNFRTGERIEIIPSNINFVSSKSATVRQY